MKRVIIGMLLPTILNATNIYTGQFRPQSPEALQHPLDENIQLLNHREFFGQYIPGRFANYNSVTVRATVRAPNGRSTRYVDTTAFSYNEFEIVNQNNSPVTCIVTRSLCLDNNEACINAQDTYLIPRGKNVRDKGSRLYNTWKYQYQHSAVTFAAIYFEGCADSRSSVYHFGTMQVEV